MKKTYKILSNFLSFGGALYGSKETINLTDAEAAPLLVAGKIALVPSPLTADQIRQAAEQIS